MTKNEALCFSLLKLMAQRDFDQMSAASVRSHISNMNFWSPVPLPKDPKRIPLNQQIGQSYAVIEQEFPDLQPEKLVSMLYKNVIAPKVEEKERSEASLRHSKVSTSSVVSRYSNGSIMSRSSVSSVTSIDPAKTPFKVQPNIHHTFYKNQGKLKEKRDSDQEQRDSQEEEMPRKKRRGPQKRNKAREKKLAQELKETLRNMKDQTERNLRKAEQWKSQNIDKQHHLFSKKDSTQFTNKVDQLKYQQKRLVARGYCQKSYGLDNLKDQVWQREGRVLKMDKKHYKHLIVAALHAAFRKLEEFLIEDCQKNIKALSNPQMRALSPILCQAKLKFQEDQYLTLRKFLKVAFDLGSVSIFEQSAVKLYIRIQLCLRGKIGHMKLDRQYRPQARVKKQTLKSPGRTLNQRIQHESIWTRDLQFELLDTILEQKTIAKTRDTLKKKYGENAILNNVKELKSRYFKILRISIKRLIRYAADYAHKLPLLMAIQDQKVKVLIRHATAAKARLALARLYKTPTFNAQLIGDVINKVNQFCVIEQTRRIQKPKEPVISCVTDKIRHNIDISRKMLKKVTTAAQREGASSDLLYVKDKNEENYQHIVSLEHNDKLHYFRKRGALNKKGGFQYEEKGEALRKLQMMEGDDDSEQLVMFSDDDETQFEPPPSQS